MPQAVTHFVTHRDTFPPHSPLQCILGFFLRLCVGAALSKILACCAAAADDANCVAPWDVHCYSIRARTFVAHRRIALPPFLPPTLLPSTVSSCPPPGRAPLFSLSQCLRLNSPFAMSCLPGALLCLLGAKALFLMV